jgi:hypothetical protein
LGNLDGVFVILITDGADLGSSEVPLLGEPLGNGVIILVDFLSSISSLSAYFAT